MQPPPLRLAYLADPNSVHAQRWIGFFAARGHDVHLLVGAQDEVGALPDGVQLHRYRRFGARRLPLLSSLQGRAAIRRLLAELRPDVLHAHYISRYGWQARLSGFHPYVVSPWGSDLFVTPTRSLRARLWARSTLRAADLVTVLSGQMRDAVLAAGADPQRIEVVQFGVDTDHFTPGAADDAALQGMGLEGRAVIFSPRSLRPLYRHEAILPAFAELPDDLRLVMSGRNAEPAYRRAVEAQAARLRMADRLLILDEIGDDQMLALYRRARAVVSVPTSDGLPVTILEAMACGAPIVASDLPGVRELLGPVAPEALVPVGDAAALASALRAALELEAEARQALSTVLRARVMAVADQRTNMLRMESLYRDLAARR